MRKITVLPILALLVLMIVPINTADATLTFDASDQINAVDYPYAIHQASSEENGVHWIFHENEDSSELYYSNSTSGELNTPTLIRGTVGTNNLVDSAGYVFVDGETVIVSYGLYDSASFLYSIAMKKSTDGGATFGSEISITGTNGVGEQLNNIDYLNESHFIKKSESDGDLFMFYDCSYCGDSDQGWAYATDRQIGIFHSDDDGAIWTFKSFVSGFEYDSYYDYDAFVQEKGVIVEGDTIYMAVSGYEGYEGYYGVYINQSNDDGATWEWGESGNNVNQIKQIDHFFYDTDAPAQLFKASENFSIIYRLDYDYLYVVQSSDFVTFTNTDDDGCNSLGFEHCEVGTDVPIEITGTCIGSGYDPDWDAEQLGSFIAILYSCDEDGDVEMVTSPDLGANWSTPDTVLADPVTDYDYNLGIDGSVNGNNIAFVWQQILDDYGTYETHVFSAQTPTQSSDFMLDTITELSGIEIVVDHKFPSVEMTADELFVTVWENSGVQNILSFHSIFTNDGFVPDDQTAPIITPTLPPEPITLYRGEIFNPVLYVTAVDETDGDLTSSIMVEINGVDMTTVGQYTVTFSVVDMAMNEALTNVDFFVKKPSTGTSSGGGGSSSSGSSGGTFRQSEIPQLEDIAPVTSVDSISTPNTPNSGLVDSSQVGSSIADLFANLMDNRITEGIETPQQLQTSSLQPSDSGTSSSTGINIVNVISNFFQNLFGCNTPNC